MSGADRPPRADRGTVVFDLDGVVVISGEGIPGAGAALSAIERLGFRVVFATNNSTTEPEPVAARITASTGFPARPEQVVTSAMAAASMVRPADSPAYVLGEAGLAAIIAGAGIEVTDDAAEARSVVVGLDRALTYARLRDAVSAVRRGARFISTNSDLTLPVPEGLWPGGGTIAAAVALASDREPEVAGKPHPPMLEAVRARLGSEPVWMVGDRPETDVAFARAGGWLSVLVLSGVTHDPDAVAAHLTPDHVLDSIAGLPTLLG